MVCGELAYSRRGVQLFPVPAKHQLTSIVLQTIGVVIRDTISVRIISFLRLKSGKLCARNWICVAKMTTLDRGEEKIKYDDLQQHYDQEDISGYCR